MYIPNPASLIEKEPKKKKESPKRKLEFKEDMPMEAEPSDEEKKAIIQRRFRNKGY